MRCLYPSPLMIHLRAPQHRPYVAPLRFGALIEEVRFALDSPVEEEGFEPSVPRMRDPPIQIRSSGAQ